MQEPDTAGPQGQPPKPGRIRVIVADDHAVVREGIRMILEAQKDLEVVGLASDGRQAVDLAGKLLPDVVVMDVGMQEMNGIEATRLVKAQNPQIAVVALTVHENEDYVGQLLKEGASGYVLKKAAASELVSAIRAAYRGESYLDPSAAGILIRSYMRQPEPPRKVSGAEALTSREQGILELIVKGLTNRQIAHELHLSVKTVQAHRAHIMAKLDVHNSAELVMQAISRGLVMADRGEDGSA